MSGLSRASSLCWNSCMWDCCKQNVHDPPHRWTPECMARDVSAHGTSCICRNEHMADAQVAPSPRMQRGSQAWPGHSWALRGPDHGVHNVTCTAKLACHLCTTPTAMSSRTGP